MKTLAGLMLFFGQLTSAFGQIFDPQQLAYDQEWNISRRRSDGWVVLDRAERKIVHKIYALTVPESDLEIWGPRPEYKIAYDHQKGTTYKTYEVLISDRKEGDFATLSQRYPTRLWGHGQRVLARNTFKIKSLDGTKTHYLKHQFTFGGETFNTAHDTRIASANSQIAAEMFKKFPHDDIDYLSDARGMIIRPGGGEPIYASTLRGATPEIHTLKEDEELISLAALIGAPDSAIGTLPLVAELALAKGVTEDEWILNEFAPTFGRSMGQMNFQYGLYPQAHTQNVKVVVNRRTGRIIRYVYIDWADLMLDPFVMNNYVTYQSLLYGMDARPFNMLNQRFNSPFAGLERPGQFFQEFILQALTDFQTIEQMRRNVPVRTAASFLHSYLRMADFFKEQHVPIGNDRERFTSAFGPMLQEMMAGRSRDGLGKMEATALMNHFITRWTKVFSDQILSESQYDAKKQRELGKWWDTAMTRGQVIHLQPAFNKMNSSASIGNQGWVFYESKRWGLVVVDKFQRELGEPEVMGLVSSRVLEGSCGWWLRSPWGALEPGKER